MGFLLPAPEDEPPSSLPPPSEEPPSEAPSEPVGTPSEAPSDQPTPEGSVEAATGRLHLTPPPTDTIEDAGQSSDPNTLLLVFAALAMAAGLSVDRARARARR